MNPTEETIFNAALDKHDRAERAAFLAHACGGDAGLRDRVEQLLSAYGEGAFLESPAAGFAAAPYPEPTDGPGTMIGPYKLLEQIGEGGMGLVYMAEQQRPVRRLVALKLVKPGMDSKQVIARFEAERQALAMMDHPHIARILDAGTVGEVTSASGWWLEGQSNPAPTLATSTSHSAGRPYFVMELVRGIPIAEFCDQKCLTVPERLELFIQVCLAVQHAHQKGIIHRDLKPTNVLVTMHDALAVPKVIDFGIAKALGSALTEHTLHTGFAELVGTPLYMSPEQAEMNQLGIDTRSDVYSLGVILYELLTGTTPFDKDALSKVGLDEIRRMIREDDPLRPSARVSTLQAEAASTISLRRSTDPRRISTILRGELDWIVMKSLAKDRTLRYESASALAADLRCYLENMPIQARPASWLVKARKWRRRNPAAAIGIVGGLFFVLSLLAGAAWHVHQLSQSLAVSNELRKIGLQREATLHRELYTNEMRLAWQAASAGDPAAARKLLDRHEPQPEIPEYNGFEWHYLRRITQPPLRTMTDHREPILTADVSSNGRFIASGDKGGGLCVWELSTGRLIKDLRSSEKEVTTVRFSPDGSLLAAGGQDRSVRLWSTQSWEEEVSYHEHEMTVTCVGWSPDGKSLASSDRNGIVRIWDLPSRSVRRTLPQRPDVVRVVIWSPDGKLLAIADGNLGVRVYDTKTWSDRGLLPAANDKQALLCAAFSLDSRYVAAGGYSGTLQVFDLREMAEVARGNTGATWSLTFWGNDRIVVGPGNEGLFFWQFDAGRKLLTPLRERTGGMQKVRSVVVAQSGRTIVTASEQDQTVAVWDSVAIFGRRIVEVDRPISVLPRKRLVLSATDDRVLLARRLDDREPVARLPLPLSRSALAASASEQRLAVAASDRQVWIYDTETWQQVQQLELPPAVKLASLDWSADGQWLAAGCDGGIPGCWEVRTGEWRQFEPQNSERIAIVQFSPLDRLLACATLDTHGVHLWRPDRRELRSSFFTGDGLRTMRFNHDGTILIAGGGWTNIGLFSVPDGARLDTLRGHTAAVIDLAVSPDGRTLASAGADNTVRLWNLTTRRELFTLCQNTAARWLTFTGDGSLLVACGADEADLELVIFPGANEPR